ncbi:hypothetical protein B0A49_05463 [Cryomyces minteri]|uniref:Heterokaryon incompatibility domain-containing protein n=1 Tax=Cryomyces minteri TaxID=331657 RepID=A0A4U0XNI1_9PEZI|nr:hypothetical protein B0A49_05463 [Cryomyces minteri]
MRLLNTVNLRLEEFPNENGLEYAILSHRWEENEISFQDMQSHEARTRMGPTKIQKCCVQAKHDGFDYVWVDTCCIDKTSSAELTEAINSMYRWYQSAAVCYAYLSDVQAQVGSSGAPESFRTSAWLTRGWTLQELLAPQNIVFYDQDWHPLGTKKSLISVIAQITGIESAILDGDSVLKCSIAQRMSWASGRTTTRIEDVAYCLMGLFDVNMPMLYGEGEKAFLRLQEETIRHSDEHSIFAWPALDDRSGLLAKSPAAFATCRHVKALGSREGHSAYFMTNRGLSIPLDMKPWSADTYLAALHCVDESLRSESALNEETCVSIFLRRLADNDQYVRIRMKGLSFVQKECSMWQNKQAHGVAPSTQRITINVRQDVIYDGGIDYLTDRIYGFRICTPELFERNKNGGELFKVSCQKWNAREKIMTMFPGSYGTVGTLDISKQARVIKIIKLGFDFDFNPVCFLAESSGIDFAKPTFNKSGQRNTRSEWQYSVEEKAQWSGILSRTSFNILGWNVIVAGRVRPNEHNSGLWALKGDRIHGLEVLLEDKTGFVPETSVVIKRGSFAGELVWDVRIENMRNNFIRSMRRMMANEL